MTEELQSSLEKRKESRKKSTEAKINAMQKFGNDLFVSKNANTKAEGHVAIDLALELKKNLDQFLATKNLNESDFVAFKSTFTQTLHSQDKIVIKHRAMWKVVIANVAIALTGLGTQLLLLLLLYIVRLLMAKH